MKYLSYSGYKLFKESPQEYFMKYFTETAREPQNHYMAVGSAFDAYIKAELYKEFVNKDDPRMSFEALFETQVESHNRDAARKDGLEVLNKYSECGAKANLLKSMRGCIGEPKFEVEVTGLVQGVWILGRPDVMYYNKEGTLVIHDFKVNGFYSKTPPSPKPGYLSLWPGGLTHKTATPLFHKGQAINASSPFNIAAKDWATQLSMYAWVMGAEVGSDYILTIDQICCNMHTREHRVAYHSALCEVKWQIELIADLKRVWDAVQQGHIFLDMPYEANLEKQATLKLLVSSDRAF